MTSSIPVTILAGYARSGKSTFLQQLQHVPDRRSIVVGKQFATHPDDLAEVLLQLMDDRNDGAVAFDRVIVECDHVTGPLPAAQGLFMDERVAGYYMLDAIVTIVDALHGASQLSTHDAAVEQVMLADRLLLSKTDLATHTQLDALRERLRALNPHATMQIVQLGSTDLDDVLDTGAFDLAHLLALEPRFFCHPSQPRLTFGALSPKSRTQSHYLHTQRGQQHFRH